MTSVPSSELRARVAWLDADPLTDEQLDAARDLFVATLAQHTDLRVDQLYAVADLVLPQLIELSVVGAALARSRAELGQARQQTADRITAGLTALHDDPATADKYRPGLRKALRSIYRLAEQSSA